MKSELTYLLEELEKLPKENILTIDLLIKIIESSNQKAEDDFNY